MKLISDTKWQVLGTAILLVLLLGGVAVTLLFRSGDSDGGGTIEVDGITYPVVEVNGEGEDLRLPSEDLAAPAEDLVFGEGTESGGLVADGDTFVLAAEVLFDSDEDTLSDEAQAELDELVRRLRGFDPRRLSVVGHTDSDNSEQYNEELSTRRAETIAEALREGLGENVYIEAEGRGEAEPVADNGTEEGKELNRRVVVTIEE